MKGSGRAPADPDGRRRWIHKVRTYLREPAVLVFIAVAFFISAVGQAVLQAYTHENSVITTTMFSVLGSLFLVVAIIIAARRHDQGTKNRRPPSRHAH
jgi:ABC-type uncharacterized transport system permease subunit